MKNPEDISLLIVEDDVSLLDALVVSFETKGFYVRSAKNGKAAVDLIEKHRIDAVLSDIRMPDYNGLQLMTRIRELHPESPVLILMTGFSDVEVADLYHCGADAFFPKPFNLKSMEKKILELTSDRAEVWSVDHSMTESPFHIAKSFQTIDSAIASGCLGIGRGGMFIFHETELPSPGMPISFELGFINDPGITLLSGTGTIQWRRPAPNGPEGAQVCGIEFTSLFEGCRKRTIEWIKNRRIIPFIPKN